jgi:hypothetical protein
MMSEKKISVQVKAKGGSPYYAAWITVLTVQCLSHLVQTTEGETYSATWKEGAWIALWVALSMLGLGLMAQLWREYFRAEKPTDPTE